MSARPNYSFARKHDKSIQQSQLLKLFDEAINTQTKTRENPPACPPRYQHRDPNTAHPPSRSS